MTNERKYTPDGSPVVTSITAEVLMREVDRRMAVEGMESARNWGMEILDRVYRENPILPQIIQAYREKIVNPEGQNSEQLMLHSMMITIEALRRQAQSYNTEGEHKI